MTVRQNIETNFDIIFCSISNDSSTILLVLMEDDENYIIQQYRTDNLRMKFQHRLEGVYIKAKEIIQNKQGDLYLCPYLNNGVFKVLVFDKNQVLLDYNINEAIELDDKTRPNDNFPDPLVNACFVDDGDKIFINCFHSRELTMHHFIFSKVKNAIDSPIVKTKLPESTRNFPISSYFDDEKQFVYIFFRQGESFMINLGEFKRVQEQKISEWDIGCTFLYNNKVLMAKSSNQIFFYKLEIEKDN